MKTLSLRYKNEPVLTLPDTQDNREILLALHWSNKSLENYCRGKKIQPSESRAESGSSTDGRV